MSDRDDKRTLIIEKGRAPEVGAFVLGALVGAGLALLLAPSSGAETQRRIRENARKLRELTEERVRGLRDDLGDRVESAKGVVDQGRQIAAEARSDLEEKLERGKAVYRAGIEAAREEARSTGGEREKADAPGDDE